MIFAVSRSRHPSPTSSSRRRPLHFVIPAKAGIQLLALALSRSRDDRLTSLCLFSRHPWRASHFSLLAQREVTKRKGTRVTRPLSRVRCGRPGSADGPSMARSGIGAIPRADPSGLIVRPPPRHTGLRSKAGSRASAATLCGFCGQDGRALLLSGVPLCRGEDAEGKARRVARRMRASSLSGQGWPVSEPPQRPRAVAGWSRRPRYRGCPSLWLLSLGQARESDSLARDGE